MRSYNTCRPAKALHETSHARWNKRARSWALVVSVAKWCSTSGASGVSKSASAGSAIRLLVPSNWIISIILGYIARPNNARPACRGALAGDIMPHWLGAASASAAQAGQQRVAVGDQLRHVLVHVGE